MRSVRSVAEDVCTFSEGHLHGSAPAHSRLQQSGTILLQCRTNPERLVTLQCPCRLVQSVMLAGKGKGKKVTCKGKRDKSSGSGNDEQGKLFPSTTRDSEGDCGYCTRCRAHCLKRIKDKSSSTAGAPTKPAQLAHSPMKLESSLEPCRRRHGLDLRAVWWCARQSHSWQRWYHSH